MEEARRLNRVATEDAYDRSEAAAREALQLDPRESRAEEELASSLLRQGRNAEALIHAERAARLDPAGYGSRLARVGRGEEHFLPMEEDNRHLFGSRGRRRGEEAGWGWATLAALSGLSLLVMLLFAPSGLFSPDRRMKRWTTGAIQRAASRWERARTHLGLRAWRLLRRAAEFLWTPRTAPHGAAARTAHAGQRTTPESDLVGGKYKQIRSLGGGGTEVVQALDTVLGRSVVLRRLWPQVGPGDRVQTLKRARACAALVHPHLADVYEVLDLPPQVWQVSEFVPGRLLSAALASGERMPQAKAFALIGQLLNAVTFAHKSGVAHGALDPSRVLLSPQGHAKVIGFGLPCAEGSDPFACDVQSLGLFLYEMLTGQAPFKAYAGARVDGRRFPRASTLCPGLPAGVDELIDRMLGEAGVPEAESALRRLNLCLRR